MSTMQSRSASMISDIGMPEARFPELADVIPSNIDPVLYRESDGRENTARVKQNETFAIPKVGAPAARAQQEMRSTILDATPQHSHGIAPVPRITIHAFCENHNALSVLERASRDRIMSRATVEIFAGSIKNAVEFYQHNSAPNLIIVERQASNDIVLSELEELAELCDPGTKVLVIGYLNDIGFYRELLQRGVSEYVVAPINAVSLIGTISRIYRDSASNKLGQVYAFVGAKGGVGSSTVAHNVGCTLARSFSSDVVLADLDLPFGTAGLNFNVDPQQGVADAIQDSSRLDEVLLDRLLTKCEDHFSLLTAPATLDSSYDLHANAFAGLLEVAQTNVPFTILDIPHIWTSWSRNALVAADEIVITAVPDLANLRNAKNLINFLRQARPHDAPPKIVLNQVGMTKRPEIKPNEFARALEVELLTCIPFDAQSFGVAANNGKMIIETSAKSQAVQCFAEIATSIAGKKEPARKRRGVLDLRALLGRKHQKS